MSHFSLGNKRRTVLTSENLFPPTTVAKNTHPAPTLDPPKFAKTCSHCVAMFAVFVSVLLLRGAATRGDRTLRDELNGTQWISEESFRIQFNFDQALCLGADASWTTSFDNLLFDLVEDDARNKTLVGYYSNSRPTNTCIPEPRTGRTRYGRIELSISEDGSMMKQTLGSCNAKPSEAYSYVKEKDATISTISEAISCPDFKGLVEEESTPSPGVDSPPCGPDPGGLADILKESTWSRESFDFQFLFSGTACEAAQAVWSTDFKNIVYDLELSAESPLTVTGKWSNERNIERCPRLANGRTSYGKVRMDFDENLTAFKLAFSLCDADPESASDEPYISTSKPLFHPGPISATHFCPDLGSRQPAKCSEDELPSPTATTVPEKSPAPIPVPEPRDDGSECFPMDTIVFTQRGAMPISELHVGDEVLSTTGRFSTVFFFSHRDPNTSSKFVRLTTKSFSLDLSQGHLVPVASGEYVAARHLRRGAFLNVVSFDQNGTRTAYNEPIESSTLVEGRGLYHPHTLDGNLVARSSMTETSSAGGIVCSTYTDAVHPRIARILLIPEKVSYLFGKSLFGEFLHGTSRIRRDYGRLQSLLSQFTKLVVNSEGKMN